MVPGWMWTLDSVKNVQFRAVGGKSSVVFTSLCDRHHQHLSQSLFKIMRMDMCDWQPSALEINKSLSKKHGWQKIFRVFPWWAHRLGLNTALNWILGQQNSQIWCKGWHVWGDLHVKGVCGVIYDICSPTDMDLQGFRTSDTFRDKQVEICCSSSSHRKTLKLSRIHFKTGRTARMTSVCRPPAHVHVCVECMQAAGVCAHFLMQTWHLLENWSTPGTTVTKHEKGEWNCPVFPVEEKIRSVIHKLLFLFKHL